MSAGSQTTLDASGDRFSPAFHCWVARVSFLVCLLSPPSLRADFIADWIGRFADTEVQFQRSGSNVPFFPLAYASLSLYQDTEIRREDGAPLSFDLDSVSQAAILPIPASPRDILFAGEWLSYSRFEARESDAESFDAISVGLPVGWLHQQNEDWQNGIFIMPLAHRADLDNSDWSHETIGGVFTRYLQSDHIWWAFGFYYDVGQGDDIYLPYVGASFEMNDEVTISAVLPWPAILYAPDRDTLWRFGAAPAGTSWSLDSDQSNIFLTLDTWRLGFSGEWRFHGNLWFAVEGGVAGLRGLRLEGGDWKGAEFDVEETPYLRFAVNFRPELP